MLLKNRVRFVSILVLLIYIFLLLKLVVFKGGVSELAAHFNNDGISPVKPLKHNFIPFRTIGYYVSMKEPFDVAVRNVLGNMLLFIPYGFILPAAFSMLHRFVPLVLTVAFTSLFFELLQAVTRLGSFDVDDLILNTAGGITGWLMFKLLGKMVGTY